MNFGPVAAILAVAAAPVFAQWPSYPSPGPRTAAGKMDMKAPPPRMPDGKPDFSGVWEISRPPGAPKGAPSRTGKTPPPAPPPPGSPPLATFFNIGANIPGGLPLTPWGAELLAKRKADNSKDNPDAHCLPMGFMQFHMHPQPRKIIQTPRLMVIIYEANSGLRQIYLDGRPLPDKDADPWWYGYSVGHWDGDTLVVETSGFRDGIWLDVWGSPLTSEGKVTERFRRPDFGSLQIDVTIEDPKAYTKPFTVRVNQHLSPDTELMEFICQDQDAVHYVGKK